MRKRYKIIFNVEIDDPENRYPAGGDYTHLNRINGLVRRLLHCEYHPDWNLSVALDKIIDKGEITGKD